MTALLVVALLAGAPAPLPEEPLQRAAYKAIVLRAFGDLDSLRYELYRRALSEKWTAQGVTKRTNYCDRCDPSGFARDGTPLYIGMCSRNPEIPEGAMVWVATDGWLRARDTGGKVTLAYTNRRETANVDVYKGAVCPHGCNGGTVRDVPYKVVVGM